MLTFGGMICSSNVVLADKVNGNSTQSQVDIYIKSVYKKINFKGKRRLKYEVFHKAFYPFVISHSLAM
jgi:hypothetical protein